MADFEDILSGRSWLGNLASPAPAVITFSFDTKAPSYFAGVFSQQAIDSYHTFSDSEKVAARAALAQWEGASGLHFVEVAAGEGEIAFHKVNFAFTDSPTATGFAYIPLREFTSTPGFYGVNNPPLAGDVFLDTEKDLGVALTYNLLHETGHAIGMKHPFPASHPGTSQTVMDQDGVFPVTLGALDLLAAASLYGGHGETPNGRLIDWHQNPTTKVISQTWGDANSDVMGTGQQDVIDGGAGADRIAGFQKDDILKGGAGADQLYGGAGNDTLSGGPDNDVLLGGDFVNFNHAASGPLAGSDTADYSDDNLGIDVVLRLTNNYDPRAHATGTGIGSDRLYDIDNVTGGAGADSITGDQYANILKGGGNNDRLNGILGNDTLQGGLGGDTLTGGAGKDTLAGGPGSDIFDFNLKTESVIGANHDLITDFSVGNNHPGGADDDLIDLRTIDAKKGPGNQLFTFIGAQKFHHKPGELHVLHKGGLFLVEGDIDGNGTADFQIAVHSAAALTRADFLL